LQNSTEYPTPLSEAADGLAAVALRAGAWAAEPFLHEGETPEDALAAGTARRRALDEAVAEMEAGRKAPSAQWKVRFALMLGLERVLGHEAPHLQSGIELRRHQIDALAGMLTELISLNQQDPTELYDDEGDDEDEDGDDADSDADETVVADDGSSDTTAAAEDEEPAFQGDDPGAIRRFRFRHPTASGKTIAASGFVEAARSQGVLILTHRRLLVTQFENDLTEGGYRDRFHDAILTGQTPRKPNPITIQTYAWFARHVDDVSREAYQLVICDEAHTALGEKTSAAIRSLSEPVYIGMTATEELIAKQVSDVFPASVDDLPLSDAARRGLIAPLRCLRVPPVAAINSVPIVGGDFDEGELARALDHQALNQAAASLYRDRFGQTPGIVYAAGVDHAYNLAQEFRAAGVKAEAVSGKTPPVKLAETLAAYERGEINVLINAMLLAEGWNSPRATVCMHLAPTASKRIYQQRIGRIMRIHPRKEAGIVVDFVPKSSTHHDRVVSLHSLLDADFYREGARVTPAPRRRSQRRARRRLTPAPWLVPVTPDVVRRLSVILREWQRVDPRYLDDEEQRYWGTIAGRTIRYEERSDFVRKFMQSGVAKVALEQFLATAAAENPNKKLRAIALADRVGMPVERADFDDLVTLVLQAPTWEKERIQGIRTLLRALGDGKAVAPDQILVRWLWKLAKGTRKLQDRRASAEFPDGKRLLGAVANSRGHRHEENVMKLVQAALAQPRHIGVALLASAEGYTPRAIQLIDAARERIGTVGEIANALAENLPAPKAAPTRARRRRKKKKGGANGAPTTTGADAAEAVDDGDTDAGDDVADGGTSGDDAGAGTDGSGDSTPSGPKAEKPSKRRRRSRRAAAQASGSDGAAPVESAATIHVPSPTPAETNGASSPPGPAPKTRRRTPRTAKAAADTGAPGSPADGGATDSVPADKPKTTTRRRAPRKAAATADAPSEPASA
jgi:superfamily II DNA or RNA helicase